MVEYIEQGYTEPNYIEGDIVVTETTNCDFSSLQTEFNDIDISLLTLEQKIDSIFSNLSNLLTLEQKIESIFQNLSYVNSLVTYINTRTSNDSFKIDSIFSSLSSITRVSDLSTLATKSDIADITSQIQHIVLPSLNGSGSEYKDGVQVKVSGRDVLYTVERSYHSLYSDNGYTVHYDLVSSDGYRVTVPEALLTKYIPPVV